MRWRPTGSRRRPLRRLPRRARSAFAARARQLPSASLASSACLPSCSAERRYLQGHYNRSTRVQPAGGERSRRLRSSHRRLPATSGKEGLARTNKNKLTFVLIQRKVSLPWCGDTVAHPLDEKFRQYSTPASLGSSTRISDTRPHADTMIVQIGTGKGEH